MQYVINTALTRWQVANLISRHLAHIGNHRNGGAEHNRGRGRAQKAADVQVFGGPNQIEGGR